MNHRPNIRAWVRRPMGISTTLVLALVVLAGPLWLFGPSLRFYRLHSDDFAYLAGSRTMDRARENLFVPHNTHIVPAWRVLTGAVAEAAGDLAHLQVTLAVATYGTVVLAMMVMGHIVSRETGRTAPALAAMVMVGASSVMQAAATWYSAGQALWAGLDVLATLVILQGWRRSGGVLLLVSGTVVAGLGGWFWTVGYVAGPVGTVYLWADGRKRCRLAAILPTLASLAAAGVALALGARQIDATVSFHGRTSAEALDPIMGLSHTVQSIAESLVFGNLGLDVETTPVQASLLVLGLAGAWAWSRRPAPVREGSSAWSRVIPGLAAVGLLGVLAAILADWRELDLGRVMVWAAIAAMTGMVVSDRGRPLERAGVALVLGSDMIEWSFRGYLPFSSLRGIVPWYDAIPQLGAVLFAVGWWAAGRELPDRRWPALPTRADGLGVAALLAAMLVAHAPRVHAVLRQDAPKLSPAEARKFPTKELQTLRAVALAEEYSLWQHRYLVRMDQATAAARGLGIGRDGVHAAFGRLDMPELPKVYDAAGLLDLPADGTLDDPLLVRLALAKFLVMEPAPAVDLDQMPGYRPR